MRLPYSEGNVFVVPLRKGGYARGVIARAGPKGKVLFGYFFGPLLRSVSHVQVEDLTPAKAILLLRFGDLGLMNGEWPNCGTVPNWNRSNWSMPHFKRSDLLRPDRAFEVEYSDADPNRLVAEYPVEPDRNLPADSLSGYGAVEIKLTRLLCPE